MPTDAEWQLLESALGMPKGELGAGDMRGGAQNVGGKMQSTATQYGFSPKNGATNESGFSGLPGGYRSSDDGTFDFLGNDGYWWSASESGAEYAWSRYLGYDDAAILRYNGSKRHGFSVRCLRD